MATASKTSLKAYSQQNQVGSLEVPVRSDEVSFVADTSARHAHQAPMTLWQSEWCKVVTCKAGQQPVQLKFLDCMS